uniref:Uncharacterized protein n=1 Tax=Glycine max TaxID=3847 RepID=A0A0R0EQP8_SOYBN
MFMRTLFQASPTPVFRGENSAPKMIRLLEQQPFPLDEESSIKHLDIFNSQPSLFFRSTHLLPRDPSYLFPF